MPGPSEQKPAREILDLFDGTGREQLTAREIADKSSHSIQTVRDELDGLVDRGLLQTKETNGGEQVWWQAFHGQENTEHSESFSTLPDVSKDTDNRAAQQRLLEQHQQLAEFVTRINITDDLDEILRQTTVEARELVGAHQSVTSRTINQNWAQAINEVSLSDKYADYRKYDTRPEGSGIFTLVCERNEPLRMTQAELESHPAWNAFGDEAEDHPSMDGWLAVPIVGPGGQNRGLIQLSDKYHGEFTEADEAILVQLANIASAAIENARLYDELRESKERYRTLVENVPEGAVTLYDDDLRYIAAGGENIEQVGRTVDELIGMKLVDVLPVELADELMPRYRAAIEEEEQQTFEVEYDGTYYLFRAVPVRDESGNVFAGMGISQDITDRQEYQRRLEESNERLEQFAYAASHDLQEPLRMVSSYLRLIEDRYADTLDEDGKEFFEYAVDGADRMREMIDALLKYSRVETQGDPFEPVELETILSDVRDDLQLQIEESGAEITTESLPSVDGDPGQVRQVFQNLIDNAIEYSGDAPPRIHVGAERNGAQWVISVSDEGIGIDPADHDRIFDVFQRLHKHENHPGIGIGLALCQRIIERHNGELGVESEPDEGSTFYFTLPDENQYGE